MKLERLPRYVFLVAFCLTVRPPTAPAAIIWSDDVSPADPTAWTSSTKAYIGKTSNGSLTVNSENGPNELLSGSSYIGDAATAMGDVTVAASTWNNGGDLYVGRLGNGTLSISDGGAVTVGGASYVAYGPTSTGTIAFDNGTLTTQSLRAARTELTGRGTINTCGLLSDVDLVFDTSHGLSQTLSFAGEPGQDIAVNLDMSDPLKVGELGAGYRGAGSLSIRDGMSVTSQSVRIGTNAASIGEATIDGAGSTWIITRSSFSGQGSVGCVVGDYGNGRLNITNGGVVSGPLLLEMYIGSKSGSTGEVTVDGVGSALSVCTIDPIFNTLRVGNLGSGTLNITGGATVSNGLCVIGYWSTGDVKVDGAGSTWTNRGALMVGKNGSGRLTITGGATVSSTDGDIGYDRDGTGEVRVDGAGSIWTNTEDLTIGYSGRGTLYVTGGGTVKDKSGYIGAGTVTVDGIGSTWTNGTDLTIGGGGYSDGTMLNITGGGAVTATSVSINKYSRLAIDVGNGSSLSANNFGSGVVRVIAGAGPAPGATFKPISAGTWTGSGKYDTIGGTWNATDHEFTVSAVEEGVAGTPLTIDLASRQRVKVTDAQSGQSVGASFLAEAKPFVMGFTASMVDDGTLVSLDALLDDGESLLAAWEFASPEYGNVPALLSFDIGAGHSRNDLQIWHHDAAGWTKFAASDLSCNATYASFTVDGFSGYAVTTVPEPTTLTMLLGLGFAGFALWQRRRRGGK